MFTKRLLGTLFLCCLATLAMGYRRHGGYNTLGRSNFGVGGQVLGQWGDGLGVLGGGWGQNWNTGGPWNSGLGVLGSSSWGPPARGSLGGVLLSQTVTGCSAGSVCFQRTCGASVSLGGRTRCCSDCRSTLEVNNGRCLCVRRF